MSGDPWHLGVLCALDTETTCADPETARIVTACVAHIDGSGIIPPESETWLIDPDVEIPDEAAAIHGITTEHAREHGEAPGPAISDISGAVLRPARAGVPIVAFNAPFDPYRKGKRTLTATCGHYGVRIDGAHDAAADAIAAARLAWKIAKVHPHIAAMPLDELHDMQVKAKAEQAASFQDYLRRQGNPEVIDGTWPVKPWTEAAA